MTDLPLVPTSATIRDAVAVIDAHGHGIALAVDREGRLVETVTDGDVRRAMLAGLDLDEPLAALVERVSDWRGTAGPVTAAPATSSEDLVRLMQRASVRQVPLVDPEGRPAGLALLDDHVESSGARLHAMVMAGGFGRRLAPLTDAVPKPMLPIGDRPLLQRIIEQLRDAGIGSVKITTHYRGDQISGFFGDGSEFGIAIEYVPEEQPLGTAGAVGLVDVEGPLLVMNGDLLTGVDVRAMHRFHDEHDATMTVALRPYELGVPFGLVELDGVDVTAVREKPLVRGFVNAGLYLLNPEVRSLVPPGERLDMTDLIERLVAEGRRVIGFPIREEWLDVGRPDDYVRAVASVVGATTQRRSSPRPVLALVVARGGSKGLPGKALLPLGGLPLVAHAVELARRCADVERVVVSTDDEAIAAAAREAGAEAPFLRPAELAHDDTPTWPVVRHALEQVDPEQRFGSVLVLQASTPGALPADVAAAVDLLVRRNDADGVVGVSRPRHNPLWTARVERGGVLEPAAPDAAAHARRQDAEETLEVNGALYLWRSDIVRAHPEDPGASARWAPVELPRQRVLDVDDADDLALAELLVGSGLVELPWLG